MSSSRQCQENVLAEDTFSAGKKATWSRLTLQIPPRQWVLPMESELSCTL